MRHFAPMPVGVASFQNFFFIAGNCQAHFITNRQELLPTATAGMREEAK